MASPTARTLKFYRDRGFVASVVEQWVPYTKIRRDALGFADILAISPTEGIHLIQATSRSNHAARRRKLQALSSVAVAVQAGARVAIVSWAKSRKTKRWTPRIEQVEGA